jgi:hypothetical protein
LRLDRAALSLVVSVELDLARRLKKVDILLKPSLGVDLASFSESLAPVEGALLARLGVLAAVAGTAA